MGETSLIGLAEIMHAQTKASQARLRQIKDREARLYGLLNDLAETKQAITLQSRDMPQRSVDFQNQINHLRWVDQRRSAINIELAQVRALIEMAREELKQHFGREQSLGQVVEQHAKTARQMQLRRQYYGS